MNRLSTMQVSGLSGVTMAYSAAGRITSRTDLGSYAYTGGCGGGPLAVKSAAGKSYCYDASGRMTSRGGSAITWFSYDLPKKINNGTASTEFTYGVNRARITQTRKTGSTTNATIRYIGDLLEREVAGSTTTWRHHVSARGRVVAQVNRVNTTNTVQYLHRDHQSSVVEVTSATGTVVQSLAFDAWGLRRNAATWAPLASPFGGTQPTKRGYTGHEHLDNVELVHMNGRVRDPRIGLFISADPFVQAPYHSQSHNRYSYVWHNPLSFIDPSGFNCEKLGDADCTAKEELALKCLQDSSYCVDDEVTTTGRLPGQGESYFDDRSTIEAYRRSSYADDAEDVAQEPGDLPGPDEQERQINQVLLTATPGATSASQMNEVRGTVTLTFVAANGRGSTNVRMQVINRQFDPTQRGHRTDRGPVREFELRAGRERVIEAGVPRDMSASRTRDVVVVVLSDALAVTVTAEFTNVMRRTMLASN